MAMKESVMETVFSFGLGPSFYLVKLYVFTKTDSGGAYKAKTAAEPVFSFKLWRSLFLAKP